MIVDDSACLSRIVETIISLYIKATSVAVKVKVRTEVPVN